MQASEASYGIRDVARLSGVSAARVRSLAQAGVVEPQRDPRGEWRFDFRDVAFLRRLGELPEALSPRRLRRALLRLRASWPADRDLRELGLATAEGQLVVREAGRQWCPDSGQCVFDFSGRGASPLRSLPASPEADRSLPASPEADRSLPASPEADVSAEAERWYRLGCELERADLPRARQAYERTLALDPSHAEAHVNLGCLEHEAARFAAAEAHYRAALAARPDDATARFDLAVVLEDAGRMVEARDAYRVCLESDPDCAEAHYNLARISESLGDEADALRHLVAYRRLDRD